MIREPEARQSAAFEALVRAAEARADFRARVEESAARVAALKAACRVAPPAPAAMLPSLLGTPAHQALAGSFGAAGRRRPPAGSPVTDSLIPARFRDPHAHRQPLAGRQGRGAEPSAPRQRLVHGLHGADRCGALAGRLLGEVAEQEGVVEQHDAARAQVVGRPVEVARVPLLVGVDEDQIVGAAAGEARQHLHAEADVDAGAGGEAGAPEALARDLGVARLDLDGVEHAVSAHAAQDGDARVAAQRADLDGAARAGGAGQHLEVAGVERRDLDVGQPGGGAARADLGQDLVLRRVDRG